MSSSSLGIDFTIIPGKGPKILKPIATLEDIQALGHIYDVEKQVPFLGPILKVIDEEVVIVVMMRMDSDNDDYSDEANKDRDNFIDDDDGNSRKSKILIY
jgi:hypothetical protein